MKQNEMMEMASECGLIVTPHIEKFAKLVASKERSEMRKGYAGVTLWVGDACVTQIVSEALIDREIKRGLALEYAANKCLSMYREARGEA